MKLLILRSFCFSLFLQAVAHRALLGNCQLLHFVTHFLLPGQNALLPPWGWRFFKSKDFSVHCKWQTTLSTPFKSKTLTLHLSIFTLRLESVTLGTWKPKYLFFLQVQLWNEHDCSSEVFRGFLHRGGGIRAINRQEFEWFAAAARRL